MGLYWHSGRVLPVGIACNILRIQFLPGIFSSTLHFTQVFPFIQLISFCLVVGLHENGEILWSHTLWQVVLTNVAYPQLAQELQIVISAVAFVNCYHMTKWQIFSYGKFIVFQCGHFTFNESERAAIKWSRSTAEDRRPHRADCEMVNKVTWSAVTANHAMEATAAWTVLSLAARDHRLTRRRT